ncbi:unnamed protein product [Staurois parvus]|uniref:Uncharacterized protein n=1 Tax=Staurois parvus TaxID=386267 RepID=A0ABN9E9X3_9NEOB|nr:unnamed protein product [Staurois parvus]
MTRDCRHSTGDDQRLQTFGEWGGLVPQFHRYPLPLPRSCPPRSLVGHMTGPRRLQVATKRSAVGTRFQVPTLKMLAPGREDGW